MKKIYYSLMLLLGGMFMINTSCSDDDEKDTMAPGQIDLFPIMVEDISCMISRKIRISCMCVRIIR